MLSVSMCTIGIVNKRGPLLENWGSEVKVIKLDNQTSSSHGPGMGEVSEALVPRVG